jgi:hypothetical protein
MILNLINSMSNTNFKNKTPRQQFFPVANTKKRLISQAWWHKPIVPVTQETKAGGSFEFTCSRTVRTT